MTSEEAATEHPRTWYLPQYGVFNPNKPGKIRLVFDAAAKFQGTSLNDALYTGPDLLNNMLGVLMRFRTHHFAFSAYIEGMSKQVKVNQEDTQSLRFLWKEDIDSPDQSDTYQLLVHIMENIETGQKIIKEVIDIDIGGNRLTKFVSNDAELPKNVQEELTSPSVHIQMEDGQNHSTKALGITWNTKEHVLTFLPNIVNASSTKRGILSVISSLYDPLGFLSPFTTTAKIILQDVREDGTNWDEPFKESGTDGSLAYPLSTCSSWRDATTFRYHPK
ncbi:uncharacterized protein [Clytia hemisphaerica]|uniref:uncharacterized protein n=1 Tax=Clytia hemisphaerica TaxID=252671 RepID=UPI0034D62770